jgi:hypothetical protein
VVNRQTLLCAVGLVLALIPALVFLLPAGYFASSDGMIHLYRLFELDRAIGEGVFFPRWFPFSAYGYGLPVLNYYPPLVYYLAEVFHLLGAGYIAAIKLTIATSFALAAFSMFLFARAWLNDGAAFVAAIAYAYSPYLLSDAYVRGNFPEMLAMSLLPLALYSVVRLSSLCFAQGKPPSSVLRPPSFVLRLSSFVLISAAIILSHHLTAMQFVGLLVVYAGFLFVVGDWRLEIGDGAVVGPRSSVLGPRSSVPLLRASLRLSSFVPRLSSFILRLSPFVLGLAVALALAAFYWVPALAELNLVYVESASLARFLVSRLIHPADFFTPALAYTYVPQNDALKRAFGFPQTMLALLAGVIALFQVLSFKFRVQGSRFKVDATRNTQYELQFTLHVLFFSLLVAFSIFMTLTPSAPLWYAIPTLRFMQFPWRFQILAAIGIAFLMGVWAQWLGDALARWRARQIIVLIFALTLIMLGIANLPLRDFPLTDAQVDLTRVDDSDYVVAQMGWGWTREFLPATVREFENIYTPIVKPTASPLEATRAVPLVHIESDGLYARALRVFATEPFELSLKAFFFPGWQAYVDDVPARTYPRGSLGIVTVQVPAGEHRVVFRFEDTPLRLAMNVVSLLTLAGVLAVVFITHRRAFIALLGALIVFAMLFTWRAHAPRAPAPIAMNAMLDARVQLVGYTVERVDQSLRVTLHWLALAEMDRNYHSYVHLLDADGNLIAQSDGVPDQGLTPTTRWLPGEIVSDRRILALNDVSRGEYRLRVGMYLPRENEFENVGEPIELAFQKP